MRICRYLFVLFISLILFSCNKFKGSQEIPAYLRIEPWSFTTNYDVEGAATQAITDAWVYVNGSLLGCFEMKSHDDGVYSMIPVLEHGEHDMQFYPGIKLNGISSTRVQYPFYQPYKKTMTLKEGDIQTVTPATRYYSIDSTSVRFKMKEDFENVNNIQLYRLDSTYAELHQISHRTDPNAWLDPFDTLNHYRSGHIHLDDSIRRFCVASGELYGLPTMGNYVILELDYKCDVDFLVGMYIKTAQHGIQDKELYYFRPSSTWNKVYINFSPTITDNFNATYVKFYLRSSVPAGQTADFYFDNLKLIYLE